MALLEVRLRGTVGPPPHELAAPVCHATSEHRAAYVFIPCTQENSGLYHPGTVKKGQQTSNIRGSTDSPCVQKIEKEERVGRECVGSLK